MATTSNRFGELLDDSDVSSDEGGSLKGGSHRAAQKADHGRENRNTEGTRGAQPKTTRQPQQKVETPTSQQQRRGAPDRDGMPRGGEAGRGRGDVTYGGEGGGDGGTRDRRGGIGKRGGSNFGGAGQKRAAQENAQNSDEEQYRTREGRNWQNDRGRGGRSGQTRHRDFDRHVSGTNRVRGMKKDGGGAHNWGAAVDDMTAEPHMSAEADWTAADSGGGWGAFDFGGTAGNGGEKDAGEGAGDDEKRDEQQDAEQAAKVKEPENIDLEEYKRIQNAKRQNLPTLPSAKLPAATQRSDLEREGYVLHVKEADPDKKGGQAANAASGDYYKGKMRTGGGDAHAFEAVMGDVRPRSAGRGRGRGRGRGASSGDRMFEGSRDQPAPVVQHAPPRNINLSDEQAFPGLA